MARKGHFLVRKFDSLEAMKAEEYEYWRQRPDHERLSAVSELTTEVYRLKDPSFNVPRLQRTLVQLQRSQG